jgi:hypothetical protein
MTQSCITQEDHDGTAVRTFSPQDHAAKKPRLALAASSGTTGSQGTHPGAALPRALLGRDCRLVAEKAWDGGPRLQDLHAQYGIAVLTPVQASPTRQVEFDAVPLAPYAQTVWGQGAAVSTTLTNGDGPWRMLLKKRPNDTDCALITPACALTADTAMPTSTTRWRMEHVCAENAFLGGNHLPSRNLHALQTMLARRLLAFHVVDNFRHDLEAAYQKKTPELSHRACVDGVQGRVP